MAATQELAPVSLVWPMGFGWSSCIAQSYMVSCVLEAGFQREQLLTEEGCLVSGNSGAVSVATDDILHFFRGTAEEVAALDDAPLDCLDAIWGRRNVVSNDAKRLDLRSSGVALGVVLQDGCQLLAKGSRVADLIRGLLDLLKKPFASPREIASYTGVLQWHNLLNRPLFSCLHEVYDFQRLEPETERRPVPAAVREELCLNMSLLALWTSDLSRPWMPCMPATDASGSFGFGFCLAACEPELVRETAAHAGREDHHIRLCREASDPSERPRCGREKRLPLRRQDFKKVLGIRARRLEHSGALEATAVVIGMRRLSRKPRLHSHRGVFLVDAQAVRAALQKGRSSAGTLRHPVAQAAAVCLACDWRWRFAYLPSESNPADDPSRGVCLVRSREKPLHARKSDLFRKTRRRLRCASGAVDTFTTSASSWPSSSSQASW